MSLLEILLLPISLVCAAILLRWSAEILLVSLPEAINRAAVRGVARRYPDPDTLGERGLREHVGVLESIVNADIEDGLVPDPVLQRRLRDCMDVLRAREEALTV